MSNGGLAVESDRIKELEKTVSELSGQNKFLKKKNHELTFRLMQLEREKNDRIRLQEAEEWYNTFCQRTKYPAPLGNGQSASATGPPPSGPQRALSANGQQPASSPVHVNAQQMTAQVSQQAQLAQRVQSNPNLSALSPLSSTGESKFTSPVPQASPTSLPNNATAQDPTKTTEFLTVYQSVYNQLAAAFPFVEPQAISFQAQVRTLTILQQQTSNPSPTPNSVETTMRTNTLPPQQPNGDSFVSNEWSSVSMVEVGLDDSERSALSSFESVFSTSGVFSGGNYNNNQSQPHVDQQTNGFAREASTNFSGGWGASSGAVWN